MTDLQSIADLELRIGGEPGSWQLSTRLTQADDRADIERGPFSTSLDEKELLSYSNDLAAYGAALSAMIFADPLAVVAFTEARATTLGSNRHLRIRLHLPASLHHLRWETLIDPRSKRHLALEGELLLLSRYLSGEDFHPVGVRPKQTLRALIAVAAPRDVDRYGLSPIVAEAELKLGTDALTGIQQVVQLSSPSECVTWETLEAQLRLGFDILYLVCHGALINGRPILYLEKADSTVALIDGALLVDYIRGLGSRRPLLVVLASCESASDGHAATLAALGPQLAQAGVPVVLAMQGKVSITTNALFQAVFLTELLRDGFADRASSMARVAVRSRSDWWMPVLYTRLRDGHIWEPLSPIVGLETEADYYPDLRNDTRSTEWVSGAVIAGRRSTISPPASTLSRNELRQAQARLQQQLADQTQLLEPKALPQPSLMPFEHNPYFVGRSDELRRLAELVQYQAPVVVTTGIGGIGKTQLVVEFVHVYGSLFPGGVFWLNASTEENLQADIVRCGGVGVMGLYKHTDGLLAEEKVQLVRAAWAGGLPCLIIFDNCEEPQLFARYRPPTTARVLLTSQRGDWPASLATSLPLEKLSREQSCHFLQRHRPDIATPIASEIAHELGDLPLALHLAGHYLEEYRTDPTFGSPETFLAALRDNAPLSHPALDTETLSPTEHTRPVVKTFELSYRRLRPEDPLEALSIQILTRAACLAPGEAIPHELLINTIIQEKTAGLEHTQASRAIVRLLATGLLERAGLQSYRLHRLIAAFVRGKGDEADALSDVISAIIRYMEPANEAADPRPLIPLRPHVVHLADVTTDRADPLAYQVNLQYAIHLRVADDLEGARTYTTRALAAAQLHYGRRSVETTYCLNTLALTLRDLGLYREAQPVYKEALETREYLFGPDNPLTAQSLNNFGVFMLLQRQHEEALKLLKRALDIRTAQFGDDDLRTAETMKNLAWVLEELGRLDEAEGYCQRSLAIRERILGTESPLAAQVLEILAVLEYLRTDYRKAIDYNLRVLNIREQALGSEHPATGQALKCLGIFYQQAGDYAEARAYYGRALKIQLQRAGGKNIFTAYTYNCLASLSLAEGDIEAAITYYRQALSIFIQAFGPTYPDTQQTQRLLDDLFQQQQSNAPEIILPKPDEWKGGGGSDCACSSTVTLHDTALHLTETVLLEQQPELLIRQLDAEYATCVATSASQVTVLNRAALALLQRFRQPLSLKQLSGIERRAARSLYEAGLLSMCSSHGRAKLPADPTELIAWLHVTNACNLRCTYCYIRKTDAVMDEATGLAAIDAVLLAAQRHHYRLVRLKYAGGEATLNLTLVLRLHRYAQQQAAARGLFVRGVVLSNGVGLTTERLRSLHELGISLMISLDGPQATHDQQRPTLGGRGSYSRVIASIERARELGIDLTVSITVTSTSVAGLPEVARWLNERDIHFSLNFYRSCEPGDARLEKQLHEEERLLIAGLREVYRVIGERPPAYTVLSSLLDRTNASTGHSRTCAVGRDYLVIDERGRVAKCQMTIGTPLTTVWEPDPLMTIRLDQTGVQNLPVEEKEGCRSCSWRHWCAGGCPVATYRATGRYDVKSPNCAIYTALLPELIDLEGRRLLHWHRAHPEAYTSAL